jgi:hypothetical protein
LEEANFLMKKNAPVLDGDGPSKTLLEFMKEFNFEKPKNWKGFRPLTSK